MEVDIQLKQEFNKYLEDYIFSLGRRYLPNEDYDIQVVYNKNMDKFEETTMDNVTANGVLSPNTLGITLFPSSEKAYKKFNEKVGCVFIFLDNLLANHHSSIFADTKGYNLLTHIRSTVLHECRHAQQFAYMVEQNDLNVGKALEIITFDSNNYDYSNQYLELDALIYSYRLVFDELTGGDTWKENEELGYMGLDIMYKILTHRMEKCLRSQEETEER